LRKTKFVTGYSYKGGVGRSTALANVACLLAEDSRHPQKVLVWDFDLEAPGMHRLFPPGDSVRAGFVDLAFEYASLDSSKRELPDIADFIYESNVENVHVLPAGIVGAKYCEKLAQIDWSSFFDTEAELKTGFFSLLVEWIKEVGEYDYVFVDSRTGFSDVAGICTQILPDILMVFFRLTEQNLDGIRHLVPAIKGQLRDNQRHVDVIPVVSPVLPHSSIDRVEMRSSVEKAFGNEKLRYVRFDQDLVSNEKLVCKKSVLSTLWPEPVVVGDYTDLSKEIRILNNDDTQTQERELDRRIQGGDFAGVRTKLANLITRRPMFGHYWRHLRSVAYHTADGFDFADRLVDRVAREFGQNRYVLEWEATRLADEADSWCSDKLTEANSLIEQAIEEAGPNNSKSLLRMSAEINSCLGNLDAATKTLEKLVEITPRNFQLKIELANLYIRRGRDFFILARNILEPFGERVQSPALVYLLSFFDDENLAGHALERLSKANEEWMDDRTRELYKIHSLNLLGHKKEALKLAENAITTGATAEKSEKINFGEALICLSEYEAAIKFLEKEPELSVKFRGLVSLARYFLGEGKEKKVVDHWENYSWNFVELLFFREHAKKLGTLGEELEVIEKLICQSNFTHITKEDSVFWRRKEHKHFDRVVARLKKTKH